MNCPKWRTGWRKGPENKKKKEGPCPIAWREEKVLEKTKKIQETGKKRERERRG